MKLPDQFRRDDGYTLIETLVAMVLFLGIVIPLVTVIGTMMLDGKPAKIQAALLAAESEMNTVVSQRDFVNKSDEQEGGFRLERSVTIGERTVLIEVSVKSTSSNTSIVSLRKTLLRPM